MAELKMVIEGMSCGHCVAAVKAALESIEGVETVDVEIGEATVRVSNDIPDAPALRKAVEDEGYKVTNVTP